MPQTKDEAILKAHHFDLIYAQSWYLYRIFLYAPHPDPFENDMSGASHVRDGVIKNLGHITTPYNHPTPYRNQFSEFNNFHKSATIPYGKKNWTSQYAL